MQQTTHCLLKVLHKVGQNVGNTGVVLNISQCYLYIMPHSGGKGGGGG